MTIVKELNELAQKMTGTNPKAKTDAQALDYIEQNFSGGSTLEDANIALSNNAHNMWSVVDNYPFSTQNNITLYTPNVLFKSYAIMKKVMENM